MYITFFSGKGMYENVLDTNVKRQTSILPVDDGDVLLDYEVEEPNDEENLAKDSDNENANAFCYVIIFPSQYFNLSPLLCSELFWAF